MNGDVADLGAGVPLAAPRCPACDGANDCAPARAGRFDVACWCAAVPREAVSVAAIAAVPEAQRGRACLCRACLTGGSDRRADQRGT